MSKSSFGGVHLNRPSLRLHGCRGRKLRSFQMSTAKAGACVTATTHWTDRKPASVLHDRRQRAAQGEVCCIGAYTAQDPLVILLVATA